MVDAMGKISKDYLHENYDSFSGFYTTLFALWTIQYALHQH